ncbi:MAG: formate dehydrogenase accessory sulfurtransferase FdhD [Thermanaerothrix sp.]|nr:formate dehydrogenase accessory sulfurtransferase FdhD [Thermanaerothrix sp.]
MEKGTHLLSYWHFENQRWVHLQGEIITETPVDLSVNGERWITLMCTPSHLEALALGFLYNEGIIQSAEEAAIVHVCDNGCNVDVWLNRSVPKPSHWRKTSGCSGGITSQESEPYPPPLQGYNPDVTFTPEEILYGLSQLYQAQDLYQVARGIHSSALGDGKSLLIQVEDIGRHNTLDKIAGEMLLQKIFPPRRILFTTGRISSEMLQKAARLGAHALVSRTSPTALSVRLAEQYGITLIGYARRNQFNVYTHPERIHGWPQNHLIMTPVSQMAHSE